MLAPQTQLDLNGPVLSFVQHPESNSVCSGGISTFIGIATASFPNTAFNDGYISYKWYAVGYGELSDGTFRGSTLTGTATSTLVVSNANTPQINQTQFYVGADYVSLAYSYPVGSAVTAGTARYTGNATNEILNSNSATLTVYPTLSVSLQPSDVEIAQTKTATFRTLGALSDTTQGNISYRWQLNGTDLSDSSTVVGSGTTILSIALPNISNNTVRAKLTHPTSCSSPVYTNSANYIVTQARELLSYEWVTDAGIFISSGEQNILSNPITFQNDLSYPAASLIVYGSEKDLPVRITLAGAAGVTKNGNLGGQGGVSVFTFTFRQNTEYVIKLGDQTTATGGFGGGGGAAYLYSKGTLVAACGGGGGAGIYHKGGAGGGIGVPGERGFGPDGGVGASRIDNGQLPTASGYAASGSLGGQVSGCTIGDYYRQQGYAPCQDIGLVKWRGFDGTIATQTTDTITRGFKTGLGYRNNGGAASDSNQGGGGSGAYGGSGAASAGSGGGGGSGYSNGTIPVVISAISGGNSTSRSYITIESTA